MVFTFTLCGMTKLLSTCLADHLFQPMRPSQSALTSRHTCRKEYIQHAQDNMHSRVMESIMVRATSSEALQLDLLFNDDDDDVRSRRNLYCTKTAETQVSIAGQRIVSFPAGAWLRNETRTARAGYLAGRPDGLLAPAKFSCAYCHRMVSGAPDLVYCSRAGFQAKSYIIASNLELFSSVQENRYTIRR